MTSFPTTSGALAATITAAVVSNMERLVESTVPDLQLPSIYAGLSVDENTRAELIYVLGLMLGRGITEVGSLDVRQALVDNLERLQPDRVEAFSSYRVAETAMRLGGLDALNPRLRDHVLRAASSPRLLADLATEPGRLHANYLFVAARCEKASADLRGTGGSEAYRILLSKVRRRIQSSPTGWLNDGRSGYHQYDIYTPDSYLIAEPYRDDLGDAWRGGFEQVVRDLDDLAHPGGAITWGRSIGSLGLAMTTEIAGLAVLCSIPESRQRWISRAAEAAHELDRWFERGVVSAHQHKAEMHYRGPRRRLQLTLDLYGKLLLSAGWLSSVASIPATTCDRTWPDVDRFIWMEPGSAGVWSYRTSTLAFTLPIMVGESTDYVPTPRSPGLFEQPTSGHPVTMPVVTVRDGSADGCLTPAGLPTSIEHAPRGLTVEYSGWATSTADPRSTLGGRRRVRFQVDGRSLTAEETVEVQDKHALSAVSFSVGRTARHPFDTELRTTTPCTHLHVETAGIDGWKSFWGEITDVDQYEFDPSRTISFAWRLTPWLRVASTLPDFEYNRCLYQPLSDRLVVRPAPKPDGDLAANLRDVDILHVGWPEKWCPGDAGVARKSISEIKASNTRIVVTQHNLLPHQDKTASAAEVYGLWASAADAVIHHSEYGMQVAMRTYDYSADAKHRVIPHGHWGSLFAPYRNTLRSAVETEEGWAPCGLRFAVVGRPRNEKNLQSVIDAVELLARDDIQLVIRLAPHMRSPHSSRIQGYRGYLSERRYRQMILACDGLIYPFTWSGMLTTGTAFDSIGAGIAALTSDWRYFDEVFQGADIRYGSTTTDLAHCLESIDHVRIRDCSQRIASLRARYEWESSADLTMALFAEL